MSTVQFILFFEGGVTYVTHLNFKHPNRNTLKSKISNDFKFHKLG